MSLRVSLRELFAGNAVLRAAAMILCASMLGPMQLVSAETVASGTSAPAGAQFEDVTTAAGITFRHGRAQFHPKLANIMPWLTAGGAGVAVADYDNDGLDDLYFTTSALGAPNHLYRNEGNFRFREVGAAAGLARVNDDKTTGTSSAALWLDYDNDGWQDLFLLRFGMTSLFHNERDGTFKEVTEAAGVRRRTNALAVTAFDYDRDGDVDVFIGGYFPEKDFHDPPDARVLFESWETARNAGRNYLFRNEGNGRFVDVTEAAGFSDSGWTMAVGHGDLDNDGWQDIYLANDFGADVLLRNRGDGTFADITASAIGVDTKKGMNADFGDYNNDGLLDVYVTNMTEPYLSECNMLWRNNGDGTFGDVSLETHACDTGWGWGAKFVDVNNDGLLDIYAANGFITAGKRDYMEVLLEFVLNDEGDISDASRWPPMGDSSMGGNERNVLLLQTPGGFAPAAAGVDSLRDGRGVAIADFDRDGRMDLVVANVDAAPNLYRNTLATPGHWLELHLTGSGKSNSSAIGARITVTTATSQQVREVASANGFDAQSTTVAHFGLARDDRVRAIKVRWPDGSEQQVTDLAGDLRYEWTQGAMPRAIGAPPAPVKSTSAPSFSDVTQRAGISARHHPPQFDAKLDHIMNMVAAGAAGGAIGDYDNDGFLDVFVNDARAGTRNHLYRNNGDETFTEVGASAGVADLNDANEVSTGGLFLDYDGDGWQDLLVLRFGHSQLFRNERNGRFRNVSEHAGLSRFGNVLAAVAFDYDRDGDIDLYLGAYFQDVNMFRLPRTDVLHESWETARNGGSNVLYRNNGDGTFSDVTEAAGVSDTGWTMAVAHADLDADGWPDLYVANDFGTDRVFHNLGNGRFADVTAAVVGIDTKKGMNAEAGDFDNDGDLDLYVTNVTEEFLRECNMLWQNDGRGHFADVAQELGVCDTGWGWAGKFFDSDNDGDLDLYVANGFFDGRGDYLDDLLPALWDNGENPSDVRVWPALKGKGIASAEKNVFFRNEAGRRFERLSDSGLESERASRAILLADFNNDGRVDVFLTNNDAPAQLFLNQTQTRNHWLEVELTGKGANSQAIGARLTATSGSLTQLREVNAGNGFGGGSMVRQHFGLGQHARVDRLVIRWPDGSEQRFENLPVDTVLRVQQGSEQYRLLSRSPQ
jgi:hypothetical protein